MYIFCVCAFRRNFATSLYFTIASTIVKHKFQNIMIIHPEFRIEVHVTTERNHASPIVAPSEAERAS